MLRDCINNGVFYIDKTMYKNNQHMEQKGRGEHKTRSLQE